MSTFPTKEKALGMYKKMYTIRKYEESIYYLFLEGIMPGSIHQSTGEEASAVGMLYDLGKDDWMATTHRRSRHRQGRVRQEHDVRDVRQGRGLLQG